MSAPVVRFKQRNSGGFRSELILHPEYLEFNPGRTRDNAAGFNIKYELLPNEFYFRTYKPREYLYLLLFLLFPALGFIGFTIDHRAIVFIFALGIVFSALVYGFRRVFPKKTYTVLATTAGNISITKDRNHDLIVKELLSRRAAALRRMVFINQLEPPWKEIKKFKWLADDGIISGDDFKLYRERILSSSEAEQKVTKQKVTNPALH